MDFDLSEEQKLLGSSLRRFFEERWPISRVRTLMDQEVDDGALWRELAELGVPGILAPEDHGGASLGMLDALVASQYLGWGMAPVPFLGSSVMATVALRESGDAALQEAFLPGLARGECRFGVAATELDARRDDAGVELVDGQLKGTALMVIDAPDADQLLIPLGDDSLALVDADAEGLTVIATPTVDKSRRFGEVRLDAVTVRAWLGGQGAAKALIDRMMVAGRIVLAGDTLGACDRVLGMAVDYAKIREQFGRPIGSFQAVKHMCADMAAEIEPARSLVWYAAHAFDEAPDEAALMAAHAKSLLSEVGLFVVRTATEVHGGIGFTDELNLHFWFKRVGVNRQLLGTPSRLRETAAQLQGW